MKTYINSMHFFGTKKNDHKNGKNSLLFQLFKMAIKLTIINIKVFLIKFSQNIIHLATMT